MPRLSRLCSHFKTEFVLIVAMWIALLPIWAFPFFPTQDGPAHLGNAATLVHYNDPALPLVREYYTVQTTLLPNWSTHIALSALLLVFPPLLAEKIFLTLYALLFVFGARYAVRAIQPGAAWLAILPLLLLYNRTLHKGFYNFNLSLAFYFLFMGYWFAHSKKLRPRDILALIALSFCLYLSHLVSLVMSFTGIAALTVIFLVSEWRATDKHTRPGLAAVKLGQLALICLPMTVLSLAFVLRERSEAGEALRFAFRSLQDLMQLDVMVTFPAFDSWIGAGIVACFTIPLVLFLFRLFRRGLEKWDGLLLVGALYVAFYAIAPNSLAGGSFLGLRLELYPWFVLVFWLAAQAWTRYWKRLTQGAALALLAATVLARLMLFQEISPLLADFTSAAATITPNSTLVTLMIDSPALRQAKQNLGRDLAFAHAEDYLVAERGVVSLTNYEAKTDYFPLMYREPFKIVTIPDEKEIKRNDLKFDSDADFVYIWGNPQLLERDKAWASYFGDLTREYEPVLTTPLGYGIVYQRKSSTP